MDIPGNWTVTSINNPSSDQDLIVDAINKAEFEEISKLIAGCGKQLIKLQRVQNRYLYQRYQVRKAEISETVKKYKPKAIIERRLFHGSSQANINSICKSGFDRDYSGKSHGEQMIDNVAYYS